MKVKNTRKGKGSGSLFELTGIYNFLNASYFLGWVVSNFSVLVSIFEAKFQASFFFRKFLKGAFCDPRYRPPTPVLVKVKVKSEKSEK